MRTAVLSSVPESSHLLLTRLLMDKSFSSSEAGLALLSQLAAVVGARRQPAEACRKQLREPVTESASIVF